MSRSQFAVYQLKKKPELRNLLFRTYEELAQDQIPVSYTHLVVGRKMYIRKIYRISEYNGKVP